jgi:predicted metal-dependent phosphoesterase TrpH
MVASRRLGDTHLHTVHSDGRRTPAEVAAGARAAGLDFIVSTDHNTSSAPRPAAGARPASGNGSRWTTVISSRSP